MSLSEDEKRIVDWLQEDAAKTRADLQRLRARCSLTISQTAEWEALIGFKLGLANAIERGEHRSKAQ